jgi:calmodulin
MYLLFSCLICSTDGSGEVEFEEFVAVMSKRVNVPYSAGQVKSAFQVFEGACPRGFVRADELIAALVTYGPLGKAGDGSLDGAAASSAVRLTAERAAELVSQLEPDSNGLIDYASFVDMMMAN